jgi:hypothetical protein
VKLFLSLEQSFGLIKNKRACGRVLAERKQIAPDHKEKGDAKSVCELKVGPGGLLMADWNEQYGKFIAIVNPRRS